MSKKAKEKFMKRLETYVKNYRRKQYYGIPVRKQDYVPFLQEVDKAIADMLREIPEPMKFLHRISKESNKWLNEMDEVNLASFKAGVCYGVWTYCNMQKLKDKTPEYVQ